MNSNHHENADGALRSALDTFETSLAVPIIGGELDPWCNQVRAGWNKVDPLVQFNLSDTHPKLAKQILTNDLELSAEVDKLKAEDQALENDRACLSRLVDELAHVAPIVEPDERKVKDHIATLVKKGIEFVSRMKKQEVILETWYQEAFTRDRGVVD